MTKEELIETEFAKQIQKSIRQWVIDNKNNILLIEYIKDTKTFKVMKNNINLLLFSIAHKRFSKYLCLRNKYRTVSCRVLLYLLFQ